MGRGGGLVVSILAFYSDNPSSIPAGYLNFLYEKTKMHKKRPGLAHIFLKLGISAVGRFPDSDASRLEADAQRGCRLQRGPGGHRADSHHTLADSRRPPSASCPCIRLRWVVH